MQNLNMLMLMLYVLLILILGQPEMIVTLFSKVEEVKPLCQFKPQDAYLKKGAPFHWTSDCQGSFDTLKKGYSFCFFSVFSWSNQDICSHLQCFRSCYWLLLKSALHWQQKQCHCLWGWVAYQGRTDIQHIWKGTYSCFKRCDSQSALSSLQ